MDKKRTIASIAAAATITAVVLLSILAKPDGGAPGVSSGSAASVGGGKHPGEGPVDADSARRQAAEEEAARKLLNEFERYMARLRSGDDTLSGRERVAMAYKLEQAIEFSPSLRAALKKRLQEAFRSNDIDALYELERPFTVSEAGATALMDIYAQVVKSGGSLEYYALQNASHFLGAMSDEAKSTFLQGAFSQLQKHDDFEKYNGAMLFLSSMARSGLPFEEQYRRTAVSMIQDKLSRAGEGDAQYFAAQHLYKLMSAQDAARQATSILGQRPTFSIARATLEAIVHGRMAADPALTQMLMRVAAQQAFSQDQSRTLQALLAQVPSNQANSGHGGGG